jgi:Fructose-bisphosphate aldolase class-I
LIENGLSAHAGRERGYPKNSETDLVGVKPQTQNIYPWKLLELPRNNLDDITGARGAWILLFNAPQLLHHQNLDPFLTNHLLFVSFLQFESIGVANEESNRRDLREMLFTSPDIEKYISGVVSSKF